ncbi:Uncharacterised protein [Escherichia coli]|uniref:Uncharacterized protein n=1 Tax=Escherichia coli TaxID=562 RepID=A0A377APC2_ECOLX|nr:Uncharacterised protein [Escherichia coli]
MLTSPLFYWLKKHIPEMFSHTLVSEQGIP